MGALAMGCFGSPESAPVPPPSEPPVLPPTVSVPWTGSLPLLIGTSTAIAPTQSATAGAPFLPDTLEFSSLPPAYREVQSQWATATTAVARGDPQAAEAFLRVARRLRALPPTGRHGGAFRAARCMAYENVAGIWAAMEPATARERLEALADRDPDCAASIRVRTQALLPRRATASSSSAASF